MSFYNYPQVVPHLVEDVNLKRARVETEEGDAIRVTGINCGDKVTIVPTLSEGTKIADFTINNVDGELYAPEAPTPPVTEVSITPSVSTGTKIADFSINNVAGELYTPAPSVTEVSVTPTVATGTKIADFSINNVAGELYAPASQGVGEAYPGSTGGEIFNYYGTDANANTASGEYSTTIGKNNKNIGNTTLVGGSGNTISGDYVSKYANIVFGSNNSVNSTKNTNTFASAGLFGYGNSVVLDKKNTRFTSSFLMGNNLLYDTRNQDEQLDGCVILGKYNRDFFVLSNPCFCVGCGSNENRNNAMEINETNTKICNDFQLRYDNTIATAITPASSNPPTQDDTTLVTKSYLANYSAFPMTHLVSALTGLDETSFPLSFYTYWSNARPTDANMKISLRINGSCYSKSLYNCLAVDGSFECYRSSYDSGTQVTTFSRYRFGWDYANKSLTLLGSMSWEMTDAGAISNVTHGLTGLVITIYQIETY